MYTDSCILSLIVLYYNHKETTAPLQGADQVNTKQKFHPINGQVYKGGFSLPISGPLKKNATYNL